MSNTLQSSAKRRELAIHGGAPVRDTYLPYGHHEIAEADIQAVVDVLRGDWVTTGPAVPEFEAAMSERMGARHAVAFSSGTAALHGSIFAAELGEGDEAITTPMTFCATANSIIFQGATPVFADVSEDTLNIDPAEVERRITPQTKALIPVDYAGHPADLETLVEIARRHGLTIIEDACHAPGAALDGRAVGSISDMTVFSFHPVKHLTTGEGGMVLTDDPEYDGRLRQFRSHGIEYGVEPDEAPWKYEMTTLGYNYRLSDVQCAIGLSQLKRLEANLARRREIAARYDAAFEALPGIVRPTVRTGAEPAWHFYAVRIEPSRLSVDRAVVFRSLRAENIGVQVHFIPVHTHPYYRARFDYHGGEYPVAEDAYERLITLPLFHGMSDDDAGDVIEAVTRVVTAYGR